MSNLIKIIQKISVSVRAGFEEKNQCSCVFAPALHTHTDFLITFAKASVTEVEPMGEVSNFDPEDLVKIFEFMDMIESY